MQRQSTVVVLMMVLGVVHGSELEGEDECKRYSLEELKASVFDPHFNYEIDLILDSFDTIASGVDELVTGLKDGPSALNPDEVRIAMALMKQELNSLVVNARSNVQKMWNVALSPNEDGTPSSLRDLRLKFQHIHQELHAIHNAVVVPFEELVQTSKMLLDPMVTMIKMFLQKAAAEGEAAKEKVFESIKEKDKFIGLVIAELVKSDINDEPILITDMVAHINFIWSEFTAKFYEYGLRNKEPITNDEFWLKVLPEMWSQRSNLECEEDMDPQECKKLQMLNIAASVFYNTEIDGPSWFEHLREVIKKDKAKQ